MQSFIKEANLMVRLKPHLHVIVTYGVVVEPHFMIVTEFMENGDLQNILHKNKHLSWNIKKKMIKGIIIGMNHLHSEGIQHLDLATRNILVSSSYIVKISDFGLSRSNKFTDLPNYGPIRWMAPELLYDKVASYKSDVYSFGITLWEIIQHKMPYDGLSNNEVISGVQHGLRPSVPSSCPPILSLVMENCWKLNPDERPDFNQILRTLKPWFDEEE
eukprot:TRINITY_DN5624_c0_g1_i6.p1 TRINITY_DN5624_c0_g1~~TRINITY_DN5624_c0_g1_i6.p1  ORF type:complete len:216 (-),score=58.68 TRINITY_DN5624_c0_g1_i6:135-782(-)